MKNHYEIVEEIIVMATKVLPGKVIIEIGLIGDLQSSLFEEEELLATRYSDARRKEFIAGRTLARIALKKFGQTECHITKDELNRPIWPPQFTGSITHKGKVSAALVSQIYDFKSLGIDLEKSEKLQESHWKIFSSEDEINQCISIAVEPSIFANVLFSMKEAVFKALSSIYGTKTPLFSNIKIHVKNSNNESIKWFTSESFNCFGFSVITEHCVLSCAFIGHKKP